MAVATVGAFALGDYVEGCAVIIFYQIGELFQSCLLYTSRFKANFINLEQTPKIFKKALTRSIPRATTVSYTHLDVYKRQRR